MVSSTLSLFLEDIGSRETGVLGRLTVHVVLQWPRNWSQKTPLLVPSFCRTLFRVPRI